MKPASHGRKIAVIGLGYVGLPVAVAFGKLQQCIGFDCNSHRIGELQQYLDMTHEVTQDEMRQSNVIYTDQVAQLKSADFYIVAVPTPVDNAKRPDLTPLENVSQTLAQVLKLGDIVVYESTVYPGVTEEFCVPILEKFSGLTCGVDFKVGYSPERINPGDKVRKFTQIVKIVSGQDQETLDIVAQVYQSIIVAGVYRATSIKVAEAAKVIENTQRDLNIALMNELAIIFDRMNIDTLEVIDAASTKWNFLPFKPGLVGGHCIGVDPYYLTYKAELLGYIPQVIQAGRRINDNMGRFIARRGIKMLIQSGHSMLNVAASVLGMTFKEDCSDLRNSKVIDLINELKDYQVHVQVHDSIANVAQAKTEYGVDLVPWSELSHNTNLLIIAVGHTVFKQMPLDQLLNHVKPGSVIIDVKSILPKAEIINRGYKLWRL